MAGRPRPGRPQTEFWRGELRPEITALADPEKIQHGLKQGANCRILQSGQLVGRPGSRYVMSETGQAVLAPYQTAGGIDYILSFTAGALASYRASDALQIGGLSGQPWGAGDLATLSTVSEQGSLYVASRSFWPVVASLEQATATWTVTDFAFAAGQGNSLKQPYFKFDDVRDVTLSVSAYTGSGVTVTASASIFTAAYVGVRIRYGGRELLITAAAGTTASADVIDRLPDVFDVTVADASGFRTGDAVLGDESGAQGVIVSVNYGSNILRVLITAGFEGFTATEELQGPDHYSDVSSQALVSAPPATLVWDEAFMSTARGYPGAVAIARRRLIFTDFPQKPDAVLLMAVNDPTDGDVESGQPISAILEFIRGVSSARIKFAAEAERLVLLGENQCFWVADSTPEGGSITPDTIAFKQIAATGSAAIAPVVYDDTVVFVEKGGNRVMGIVPSGELNRPFRIDDLSEDAAHLIDGPVQLAVSAGNSEQPERYVYVCNADGAIVVLHTKMFPGEYRRIHGWLPWSTQGLWKSVAAVSGIVYAAVTREVSAAQVWMVERFEAARLVDSSPFTTTVDGTNKIIDGAGDALIDGVGDFLVWGAEALGHLNDGTIEVAVIAGNRDYGDFTVSAGGLIDDPENTLAGVSYDAGLAFERVAQFFAIDPRRASTRRRAEKWFSLDLYETLGGNLNNVGVSRQTLQAIGEEPSKKTGIHRVRIAGVSFDGADIVYRQPRPGTLTIRSAQAEVSN